MKHCPGKIHSTALWIILTANAFVAVLHIKLNDWRKTACTNELTVPRDATTVPPCEHQGLKYPWLSETIWNRDKRLWIKSHAKQENCTGTKVMWGEGGITEEDATEVQVRDLIPDRESRKDLLDFYTAESISPKVDLKKRKREYRNERYKHTHDEQTNKKYIKEAVSRRWLHDAVQLQPWGII